MKSGLSLLAHSLKRVRTLVLVMATLLASFQIGLILMARSFYRSDSFEQMAALVPDFVRQLLGPSFMSFMSFTGIVSIGYFHIAVMGTLIGLAIALASEPASEIETGFIDLILSRPVARHWVITRSVGVLVVCILFLLAMMTAGTALGLYWLAPQGAPWPTKRLILSFVINLGMLLLCWGGVGLAVSSVSRRRSVAGSITGLLAIATFLLDYVARAWQPAESVAWLSPFRYYTPSEFFLGSALPVRNLLVLAAITLAALAAAYILFYRRDI